LYTKKINGFNYLKNDYYYMLNKNGLTKINSIKIAKINIWGWDGGHTGVIITLNNNIK